MTNTPKHELPVSAPTPFSLSRNERGGAYAGITQQTHQEESTNFVHSEGKGNAGADSLAGNGVPLSLKVDSFDPEKVLSPSLEDCLCAVLCNLADVDFAGFFDPAPGQFPRSVLYNSRRTHSTYGIPVADLAIGGAELLRKSVREKDAAFGVSE